ncbi:H-NS histone family protein [Candidatus Roizmanbacteria bacterium]|nr:H-NS histone family protein [Candidatus Roizmanbacteria bacterium]
MSDLLRILTHSRRLKHAVKELSIEQLEEIKIKLQTIIDDRFAESEAEKRINSEKDAKIQQYKEMLEADGIGLEELLGLPIEKQGKRSSRPAKYEMWNDEGQHITWTGQGRMPNIFKARIDAGEPLETFLIE